MDIRTVQVREDNREKGNEWGFGFSLDSSQTLGQVTCNLNAQSTLKSSGIDVCL